MTGPVTIGNVAKFEIDNLFYVDLVLWRPRQEEFPALRGGKNFSKNTARINRFLKKTPSARAAVIGIKEFYWHERPKGMILEALVWRLSKTCSFSLTRTAREYVGSARETWKLQKECFHFFMYVRRELRNWKASSFGRRLTKDLESLSAMKREEHIQSFEKLAKLTGSRDIFYLMLLPEIFETAKAEWTTQQAGPWPTYLQKKLAEFFPYDL